MIGDVLWQPPADLRRSTEIGRFMQWLADERGHDFATYQELFGWSVDDLEGFWGAVWDFFGIRAHAPYERVLGSRTMPGAVWFPGARLNYAEHLIGRDEDLDRIAVIGRSQTRPEVTLTFGELREQAARARAGLQRLGVKRGDRVVAYLPNIPETLVAFIATTSLGAIWAACAPEFGARSVIDRFHQIEPSVLLTVGGYGYRDRYFDKRAEVAEIRERLHTVHNVISVPYGEADVPDTVSWTDVTAVSGPLEFESVPFEHPIYVLFSSGTTGLPKAIVHGHGGQLLEHHKNQGFGWDLKPSGRIQWFTTTAWMMWNALVSGLLLRSSIVMLDGDPNWPDLREQWRMAEELQPTVMGVSPPYLLACRKGGLKPGREFNLESIRVLTTAGSPLPPEGYRYVYESFDPKVLLNNGSGGTDVCTGLVQGNPALPVYEGEIAGRCLAVDSHAFDADGNEVIGELGEMVITQPMPSMPVAFWNDPEGHRYHSSYFDRYPGVWRQGDWIMFTERGSCVITGRSDATLNRGGVRLGTGEFYAVLEDFPEVIDALVVHLEDKEGGMGELFLFLVPAEGHEVDDDLRRRIARALRGQLSPRHVPDSIVGVPAIPSTLTGKKLELPVKRILQGAAPDDVAKRDALARPEALDAFVAYASERGSEHSAPA
ncbi:MAG: acetoacetate--CoA ligase [Solirubrobacterales bacterium]|nr:acetoacetate--CoA ligase [Solirubrobacterales bacterium]MBV9714631.1 acetoacetate--CoA ligase [Solirubrobacterales bacterium]